MRAQKYARHGAARAHAPVPTSCREHPIGDKSFQSYIRQQSETPAHSM